MTLDPAVVTDVGVVAALSDRKAPREGERHPIDCEDPASLTRELLPGWYDDWVTVERERLRQRSLHAVESLAHGLAAEGEFARAIDAALIAIGADPYRETAHRTLIEIHLLEGNVSEALRQFQHFRTLLHDELGLQPSSGLRELITAASGGSAPNPALTVVVR